MVCEWTNDRETRVTLSSDMQPNQYEVVAAEVKRSVAAAVTQPAADH